MISYFQLETLFFTLTIAFIKYTFSFETFSKMFLTLTAIWSTNNFKYQKHKIRHRIFTFCFNVFQTNFSKMRRDANFSTIVDAICCVVLTIDANTFFTIVIVLIDANALFTIVINDMKIYCDKRIWAFRNNEWKKMITTKWIMTVNVDKIAKK